MSTATADNYWPGTGELVEIPASPHQRAIVKEARTYCGVPFLHAGRTRGGIDCIGLLACVLNTLGMTDYYYNDTAYLRAEAPTRMKMEVEKYFHGFGTEIDPEPGDVLLIKIRGVLQHLAIATDPGSAISAYDEYGVIELPLHMERLKTRRAMSLEGIYRWKGFCFRPLSEFETAWLP